MGRVFREKVRTEDRQTGKLKKGKGFKTLWTILVRYKDTRRLSPKYVTGKLVP